jgi:hypothetical protein
MELENIILSEVSQAQNVKLEHVYSVLICDEMLCFLQLICLLAEERLKENLSIREEKER